MSLTMDRRGFLEAARVAGEKGLLASFEIDRHVALVKAKKEAGQLGRVLLSHDAGWYHVGTPGGGEFRPFDTLRAEFVTALRAAGLIEAEVCGLTIDNPRSAFKVKVRRSG